MRENTTKMQTFNILFRVFLVLIFSGIFMLTNAQNVVENGDFEDGITGWSPQGPNQTNSLIDDGTGSNTILHFDVLADVGQAWKAELKSSAYEFDTTQTYVMEFYARLQNPGGTKTPVLMINMRETDETNAETNIKYSWFWNNSLSTEWKKFSKEYTYIADGTTQIQFIFQFGQAQTEIEFDKISFKPKAAYSFDDNSFEEKALGDKWAANINTANGAAGTIEIVSDNPFDGFKAVKVDVTNAGSNANEINVTNRGVLQIQPEGDYIVSYYAKGTDAVADTIKNAITCFKADWGGIETFYSTKSIIQGYHKYIVPFTSPALTNHIQSQFGFAGSTGTIYLDSIGLDSVAYAAPTITSTAVISVPVKTAYSYQLSYTMNELAEPRFSLSNAPSWLSIDSNGLLTGTPLVGGNYDVEVVVSDTYQEEVQQFVIEVAKADQTITFDALAAKTFGDAAFDLGATISSGLDAEITYTSSDEAVATISGNTVTIIGAGTTTITASHAGNDTLNAASKPQDLVVNKASQTITFAALAAKKVGDAAFDLSATSTSALAVTYVSSDETVATISGSTVTILAAGTTTITASQAGNANYAVATSVPQDLVVTKTDQTITFDALAGKLTTDTDFDLAATATSGLAVTYASSDEAVATISGVTVTIVGSGTTTITASQVGNNVYNAAVDVLQNLEVSKAAQTITFTALVEKEVGDAAFDLTATASSGLDITYVSSKPDVATISGSTVTIVGAGSTSITASQAGDDDYSAATSVVQSLLVVDPSLENQTITFAALPEKEVGDAPFELTATASSGLALTYASSVDSVATISGNTVTIVGAGSTVITASQAGDATYNAAADVQQTLVVTKPPLSDQTITFEALATKVMGDTAFHLSATASSGLEVSYKSSDLSVATISGNKVSIVGVGTTIITASQAGNEVYNPANNVAQEFTVIAPLAISSKPDSLAFIGTVYKYQVTNTGDGTYSLSTNKTAEWLNIDSNGMLSGTPTENDTLNVTISITNELDSTAQVYTLYVDAMPKIVSTPDTMVYKNQKYSYLIETEGFGNVTFETNKTADWLTLSGDTLSGMPIMLDTLQVTITYGTNSSQVSNTTQSFDLYILDEPAITSTPLTEVYVDSLYQYQVTTIGVDSLVLTTEADWLTLNAEGLLSGTPTTVDTVMVTLTYGPSVQTFDLVTLVNEIIITPEITSDPVTAVFVDSLYQYQVTTVGEDSLILTKGADWLTLNAEGLLSGTPSAVDTIAVTLTYGDFVQDFEIVVKPNEIIITPEITSTPVSDAVQNELYTYTIETVGEATLELSTEATWLSLSEGVLSGTPTAADTVSVTLTYGDFVQTFDINVAPVVGIDNELLNKISMYPNPASQYVIIDNIITDSKVSIFNIIGEKVMDKDAVSTQMELNISDYRSGVYFVEIRLNEAKQVRKLIIK